MNNLMRKLGEKHIALPLSAIVLLASITYRITASHGTDEHSMNSTHASLLGNGSDAEVALTAVIARKDQHLATHDNSSSPEIEENLALDRPPSKQRVFEDIDEKGMKRRVEYYFNETGEKVAHGAFTVFYPNGDLRIAGRHTHGRRSGNWSFYAPQEKLINTRSFSEGILDGEFVLYHPNGKPSSMGNMKDGQREGEWKSLTYDGQVFQVTNYFKGKPVNEIKFLDDTGKEFMRLPVSLLRDSTQEPEIEEAQTSNNKLKEDDDCGCNE